MQVTFKAPTISIVVPAYNAEKTILETIISVQNQSFSDFELIIINDGSTDKTLEIINTKALDDSRIRIFSYENGGLPVARNRGIALARGKFIAFLDADDLWTPDKLELQILALQRNSAAGLAYSWTYFMDNQGKSFHTSEPTFFEGYVLKDLLLQNFLCNGSNPLIRRSIIEAVGDFNPDLHSAEDWDYWLRVAACSEFALVPKAQIFYRQSSTSMSSKVERMENYQIKVIERAFELAPQELKKLKNKSLSYIYQYSAKLYLEKDFGISNLNNSIVKLSKSIQLYPKSILFLNTQKLMMKLILLNLLPPKLAKNLLRKISQLRATRIQSSNL